MRTIVLGPRPAELDALIARRHALGQDTHDEVWEGEYHMAPTPHQRHGKVALQLYEIIRVAVRGAGLFATTEFNLGTPTDFRVPDLGVFCDERLQMFVQTAAMVVEIVSPGDESWLKFGHYAAHSVDEVLIVDPADETVAIFVLLGNAYERTEGSELLGITSAEIHDAIDWPPAAD